jgi:hypothetical protein
VALAPAIAALVGAGGVDLWDRRARVPARAALSAGIAVTAVTAWLLLERTPAFAPGLGVAVLGLGLASAIVLAVPPALVQPAMSRVAVGIALVAVLAGPLAYAGVTMQTAFSGGDPAAGPQDARGFGGPGSAGGPGGGATVSPALIDYLVDNQGSARWIVAASGSMVAAPIQLASGLPVMTMGGFNGGDPAPTLEQLQEAIRAGELRFVLVGGGGPGGGPGGFGPGGLGDGGFGDDGGFGGDGTQVGPGGGPDGGNVVASEVRAWVTAACTQVTIDGSTTSLYDCANAA